MRTPSQAQRFRNAAQRFRNAARRIERGSDSDIGACLALGHDHGDDVTFASWFRWDAVRHAEDAGFRARLMYWMLNAAAPEVDPQSFPDMSGNEEVRDVRILALCFAAALADTGDL